jgi:dolichyl-phosphate beta-glucosyltransferase
VISSIRNNLKIIKFLIVGITSTIIDLVFLYIFVDILSISLFIWVILAFLLAVINWFTWNKMWTFKDKSTKYKRQFTKFLFVSIWGLILTLLFMYIFTISLWIYYILSKLLTSAIVVIWNFLWNKYWTFKIKKSKYKEKKEFNLLYSIIIPAYNEEKRILDTLSKVDKFLGKKDFKYEIIVVDDWSKDNTVKIVKNSRIKNLEIIKNKKNYWKWYSVRNGILSAKWKYILFTDADNSTPIEELDNLKKYIEKFDIVIWSRYCKDAKVKIKQWELRQKIWKIWNLIIRYFLLDSISDTQCWFKLFKHNVAKKIFPLQKINWFWFDMEILLAWKSMWFKIKEVPVSWYNSSFSRVRPIRDSLKTFIELLFIKVNYWFDWYK